MPHSEDVLALLVNVHIRGGSKDLATHLQGLTMRVAIVAELIRILRGSGYPGYEEHGVNSSASVAQRLKERYTDLYGEAAFIPAAIRQCVNVKKMGKYLSRKIKLPLPRSQKSILRSGRPPYALTTLSLSAA